MFEFQGITARHHLKRTNDNENAEAGTFKPKKKPYQTPFHSHIFTTGTTALIGKAVAGSTRNDANKKTPFGDKKNTLANQPATPSSKNTAVPMKSVYKSFQTPKLSSSRASSTPIQSFMSATKPAVRQPAHRYVFDANDIPLQSVDFAKCWAKKKMPSEADFNKLFAPTEFLEDEMRTRKLPPITAPVLEESPMPDMNEFLDQLPPIDDFDLKDSVDLFL